MNDGWSRHGGWVGGLDQSGRWENMDWASPGRRIFADFRLAHHCRVGELETRSLLYWYPAVDVASGLSLGDTGTSLGGEMMHAWWLAWTCGARLCLFY